MKITDALRKTGLSIGPGCTLRQAAELMECNAVGALAVVEDDRAVGVVTDRDLVRRAVARGIDMFDCVLPTRSGRTAQAFTRRGTVNLKNARHADDPRPLDEASDCPAARDYSRAYLHHLVKSDEILGAMLLTWNNLWYYQDLMRGLRTAIEQVAGEGMP